MHRPTILMVSNPYIILVWEAGAGGWVVLEVLPATAVPILDDQVDGHLSLEAGDVAVTEVVAQVVDLLQLQQVEPQYLDGLDHQIVQFWVGGEEGPLRANLLGEGSDVLVEGIRGADVAAGGVPSPAPAPSRGEHVASSHFSKTRAKRGKSGCP